MVRAQDAAISLERVTFTYNGAARPSISDFELSVAPGESVVLTGASGCGKTTVVRVVNGLAHDFYEGNLQGCAFVGGHDVRSLSSWERAANVGSVFQNPRTQFFNLDTTGEVAFGMENLAVEHAEMHRRYSRVVDELDIAHLMGRGIFKLSGGQKQAVAFASAWANEPAAYVLDEPSSNLDLASMKRLARFIDQAKRDGAAVLVAEHRLFWLVDVADRFVCMRDGRIAGEWTASEFAHLPDAEREQLGMRSPVQPPIGMAKLLTEHARHPGSEASLRSVAHASLAESAAQPPACEARDLCAGYGSLIAFTDVDLSLHRGEVVGIVGQNGRGKSTLLRCLCGLHRETSGQVLFDGVPVPVKKRPDRAFLVMQDVDYQLFRTSVVAELEAVARRGRRGAQEVPRMLEFLGLTPYSEQHPASLSGGQKQRVVCAMAALSPADIVLLDEPTSGLDFTNMVRLASLLRSFAAQGKAVAVITHDAEFLTRACDRVVRFE